MKTVISLTLANVRAAVLTAVAVSPVVQAANGSTIVSAGGADYGAVTNNSVTFAAVSWTQAGSFQDVTISARLFSNFPLTPHTAYLTTRIGPGTTSADEVAFVTFSSPSFDTSSVDIFSGLTLEPGTYYLTIRGGTEEEDDYWIGDNSATATLVTDPGVTFNGFYWLQDGINSYVPASSFSPSSDHRLFSVTGTLVPEPAAPFLLIVGGGLIFRRGDRRRA